MGKSDVPKREQDMLRVLQEQRDALSSGCLFSDEMAAEQSGVSVDEWRKWCARCTSLAYMKADLQSSLEGFKVGIESFHAAWQKYLVQHEWAISNCLQPYPEDDGYSVEDLKRHEQGGDPELLDLIDRIATIQSRFRGFFFLNSMFDDVRELFAEVGLDVEF